MMFKIKMFEWIYVWVGILLTCVKHMLDSFTSLKGTMGKQLVNFITCGCESSVHFFVIYKAGRELTPYW
jgi:hypothetical protein